MFHRKARREPFVKQASKALDNEFAGAMTHFPFHNRVNPDRIPSIPIPHHKPHHLKYKPKGPQTVMQFLTTKTGLSWDAAQEINIGTGGNLHVLLQMSPEQIKNDVQATYPWRSRSKYVKHTVTEAEFKMLFAALDKERAKSEHHDSKQFASTSDIQNPFFV